MMSLDDRLPVLGAAVEDPGLTERSLRTVVARGRRQRQRRRAAGSALVVGVLAGGGMLAAASLGEGDGSQVASGGGSTTVPADASGPRLWVSHVRAAPDAIVAVALVAGPGGSASGGLLAEVERFGDHGWEHAGWASLCPPDLGCLGTVTTGDRPAVRERAVVATAGSASSVLWLRLDGLASGTYRLGMELGVGGRALIDFEVSTDGGGMDDVGSASDLVAVPGVVAGPASVVLAGSVEDGVDVTIQPVGGGAVRHAVVRDGAVALPALPRGGYRLVVGEVRGYVWADPER